MTTTCETPIRPLAPACARFLPRSDRPALGFSSAKVRSAITYFLGSSQLACELVLRVADFGRAVLRANAWTCWSSMAADWGDGAGSVSGRSRGSISFGACACATKSGQTFTRRSSPRDALWSAGMFLSAVRAVFGSLCPQGEILRALLQLFVLCLGLLQDGDVEVGVFPEGEEILVGGERPHAGGVERYLGRNRSQGRAVRIARRASHSFLGQDNCRQFASRRAKAQEDRSSRSGSPAEPAHGPPHPSEEAVLCHSE